MKRYMGVIILLVLFVCNLSAGWNIKMSQEGQIQNIYFEGQKMAVNDGQNLIIFDVKSGDMHMINQKEKRYWAGNIEEFANVLEESMAEGKKQMKSQMAMMKEQMKSMPAAQQEMMKKMFAAQDEKESVPQKMTIKKVGSDKVKNISCDKYEVYLNGEIHEKMWLSEDLPFYADYKKGNYQKEMMKMQSKFEEMAGGMGYKMDKKYIDLVASKIIVKAQMKEPEIMGQGGGWMTSEYVSSKKMNVDKYINVPAGYKETPLMQVLNPQGMPQGGMHK